MVSGLYPNVAIGDDCNSFKRDSELAFHTKNKPFVILHPTCVYATDQEALRMTTEQTTKNFLAGMSNDHELLAYVSLLETNKPYLMNVMRVPAMQTLLLYSQNIDTNADCTRLVCDSWLEVMFEEGDTAQNAVSAAIQLRKFWDKLLQTRLEAKLKTVDNELIARPRSIHLEKLLARKLAEFLNSDIRYAVRRVMAAEQQYIYIGPDREADSTGCTMFRADEQVQQHPVKGGYRITDYLTYNCLISNETASIVREFSGNMQRHWTCPYCNQDILVTVGERIEHEVKCQFEKAEKESASTSSSEAKSSSALTDLYHCDVCDKDYYLTKPEVLKHKRSHVSSTS